MDTQTLQNQITELQKQVKTLERISIQIDMDPVTVLYLNKQIVDIVTPIIAALPTQTYSTLSPSGVAPTGSIWFVDTGLLTTREIYMYSGSWIQFK